MVSVADILTDLLQIRVYWTQNRRRDPVFIWDGPRYEPREPIGWEIHMQRMGSAHRCETEQTDECDRVWVSVPYLVIDGIDLVQQISMDYDQPEPLPPKHIETLYEQLAGRDDCAICASENLEVYKSRVCHCEILLCIDCVRRMYRCPSCRLIFE